MNGEESRNLYLFLEDFPPDSPYFCNLFFLTYPVPVSEVCPASEVYMILKGSMCKSGWFSVFFFVFFFLPSAWEVDFDAVLCPPSWLPCPSAFQILVLVFFLSSFLPVLRVLHVSKSLYHRICGESRKKMGYSLPS